MKMINHVIMRVLERGGLMPYCLCWYSREKFSREVGEVVVNLMRKEVDILQLSTPLPISIHHT